MKHSLIAFLALFISNLCMGQIHIKENESAKYAGKKVEILGNAYYATSVNDDYAIMKLGYSLASAKLLVYLKFKHAKSLAGLINHEFGHFIGTITMVDNRPVLIVDKLNNASCYPPKNEMVDSAI
jgi:hypothetical protein